MRTLKKALCLVLVLAMVLTLSVSAFAVDKAADYKDYSEIKNTEAVSVLTAIGVLNGDDTGNFGPAGNFTRAQAAKMICYMTLGKTIAEALPATATQFNDVPATHWASKFIQYCANEGIIVGNGDGKFGPDDTLSASAWAKMLLVAVGFDADKEGLTGSGWEINVTKLAMNSKIATADDMTGTFNRDAAAKLAFNALNYSDKTETKTETKYVVSGGNAGTKIFDTWADASKEATSSNGTITSVVVNTETKTGSLGYKVFSLQKSDIGTDAYGRPATSWTYKDAANKTQTVGAFAKDPVAVYTTAVSANDLYKLLGSKAVIKAAGSSVTTKVQTYANTYLKAGENAGQNADITVSNKTVALGGNGIITEIYATSVENEYIVIQIQPALEQVTNVKNFKATATEGAYTQYTIGGKTYKVYTSKVSGDEADTIEINGTIAKDDYVMIYDATTAAAVATPATLVTGKLTGYASSSNSYTIDGTAYPMSAATGAVVPTGYNQTATYAIDTFGNVVASVTVTTATNFVFVLETHTVNYYDSETMILTPGVQATVITTDGELKTVKVAANAEYGIYTYTVDNKGVYTLVDDAYSKGGFAVDQVKTNTAALTTSGTAKYANSTTKFYVAKSSTVDGKVVYSEPAVYTGIASVPSLNLGGTVKARGIDADGDSIAEVVFVSATTETVSSSLVYVTGSYTSDGTKTTYDVIVNGEPDTMVLTLKGNSGVKLTAGLYSVKDGVAEVKTGDKKYMTYNNGLFMTSTKENEDYAVDSTYPTVGATVPVYTFENGECTVSTAAELNQSGSANVVVVTTTTGTTTSISAIYIVK